MAVTQEEFRILDQEYTLYIKGIQEDWLKKNRPRIKDVWEVMSKPEHEKVRQCMAQCAAYITPIAEEWWKKRGFGCIWPKDDSAPMQVYELEDVSS